MAAFIGLDLAWTAHRESGVCVLVGDGERVEVALLDARLDTPSGFAEFCASYGGDVVVAVDAPLIVTAVRRAEAELGRVFGKYKASAYSANLEFLRRMGGMAGPELALELRACGFSVVPGGLAARPGRVAVEVYPHAAHIRFFELAERLRYKKGTVANRRIAFRLYQEHLRMLLEREMPAVAAAPAARALLSPEAVDVPGKALKRLEDQLDALTCAYVAYHLWRKGAGGFEVFGSDEDGAIVVPLVPALHAVGRGHAHEMQDAGEGDA